MSELENMKDLVSKLSNKTRNGYFYDKTDTMSIASVQSSIFDLESSMTSCDFEDLPRDNPIKEEKKKYILPYKTRPLNYKNKKPENWLYCSPKNATIYERSENPIKWMRTIFDDSDYLGNTSKSNLKQQLSKSQGNLYNIVDFDITDFSEPTSSNLITHKSISDLKNLSQINDDIYDSRSNMTLSKTAPGSTENIVDTRSSFQEFIALAKKQEENLKAEVMRRKLELTKCRSSSPNINVPSMKYLKNGHLATTRNRFGYSGEKNLDANRLPSATTRYTKSGVNMNRDVPVCPPRSSHQNFDNSKKIQQKYRYNISQNSNRITNDVKTVKLHQI